MLHFLIKITIGNRAATREDTYHVPIDAPLIEVVLAALYRVQDEVPGGRCTGMEFLEVQPTTSKHENPLFTDQHRLRLVKS
jgi:hypothetical protein